MAKHKLTARKVETAGPGRHGDGEGLWLEVSRTGSKRWLYRYTLKGKTSEIGIGAYPALSLEKARQSAVEQRKLHKSGIDPADVKRAAKEKAPVPTFAEMAGTYIAIKQSEWRNEVHRGQWKTSLEQHAGAINHLPVDQIRLEDILAVLKPLWQTTPVTASRVRGRIELILDHAKVLGFRSGENPAVWRGNLSHLLPSGKRAVKKHHAALACNALPAFITKLRQSRGMSALALEFLILTASRSGEVRLAEWSEINFDEKLWSIPGNRMKAGRPHRVPLCDRAIEILKNLYAVRTGEIIFHSRDGGSMSPVTLRILIERLNEKTTVHGLRSTFRDWCGDKTNFPREVIELSLAHIVGNDTETAYRRSDALDRRRELINAWASYCDGAKSAKIVSIRSKAS